MRHPQKPLNPIKKGFFLEQENFVFATGMLSRAAAMRCWLRADRNLPGLLDAILYVGP
jgi:hypothetical protein